MQILAIVAGSKQTRESARRFKVAACARLLDAVNLEFTFEASQRLTFHHNPFAPSHLPFSEHPADHYFGVFLHLS